MTYYYIAADGSTAGPETLAVLTGMVTSGAIGLGTMVVPAGGEDWTPLARVLRYFYSDEAGNTAGPVAFSELQRLNQTSVLTGASWVLEEGAEQWKTLSQVLTAGGAEVFAPVAAAAGPAPGIPRTATGAYIPPAAGRTQRVSADPYAPPRANAGHRVVVRHRVSGGMNRMQYFLYAVLLQIVVVVMLIAALGGGALLAARFAPEKLREVFEKGWIVISIVTTVMAILGIVLAVQRLKNIGWPWYYLLFSLVPVANLWLGLALLAYPPGYAHHRRFDGPAKAIFGIYGFLIAACIIAALLLSRKPPASSNLTCVPDGGPHSHTA